MQVIVTSSAGGVVSDNVATRTEASYIEKLRDQVTALKAELRRQWESNHSEHCSNEWPHPDGQRCYWPLPVELQ